MGTIISIISLLITIIIALFTTLGPERYKKTLIKFLIFSLGLTLGVGPISIYQNINKDKRLHGRQEIFLDWISLNQQLEILPNVLIRYDGFRRKHEFVLVQESETQHFFFAIIGQTQTIIFNDQSYIIELIDIDPINNKVRLHAYKIVYK